jgi:hypothetical protein
MGGAATASRTARSLVCLALLATAGRNRVGEVEQALGTKV